MSTNVCFHVKWRFHFESHWVSQPGFADVVSSQLPSIMRYGRWTLASDGKSSGVLGSEKNR
jgi:hypothetical protein